MVIKIKNSAPGRLSTNVGQLKHSDHIKFFVATRPFLCGYVCLYVEDDGDNDLDSNESVEGRSILPSNSEPQEMFNNDQDKEEDEEEEEEDQLENEVVLSDGNESLESTDDNLQANGFGAGGVITSGPVLSDEENSISSSVQTGPITYGIEDAGFGNDDQDDDSDNDEQAFPATNAGKEQVHMLLTRRASEGGVVSSYILMNTLGRCLIRRQRNINTGQAGRYFLQKQVAVATNQSLPLIYWEGMLFPNIFWSETKDSAPVGSLPSALLNDNYVLNQLRFASLMDHDRSDNQIVAATKSNHSDNQIVATIKS